MRRTMGIEDNVQRGQSGSDSCSQPSFWWGWWPWSSSPSSSPSSSFSSSSSSSSSCSKRPKESWADPTRARNQSHFISVVHKNSMQHISPRSSSSSSCGWWRWWWWTIQSHLCLRFHSRLIFQDHDEAKVHVPSKTRNSPVISCKIQRGAKNSNIAPEFVIKPA